MIIQTFNNGVPQFMRFTIVAAVSGSLVNKTEDEAYNQIEEMALNNFQLSVERGQPKRVRGKLEVDALTLLYAKADAMTQRSDYMNVNVINCSAPPPCAIYGSI